MALQKAKAKAREKKKAHCQSAKHNQQSNISLPQTKLEEMMMLMNHEMSSSHPNNNYNTITAPRWKLYENPFYTSHQNHQQLQDCTDQKQVHRIHLPISARKITASFWDLTFIKPFMESELELARAQMNELKAELEFERKARRKLECVNKRLSREVSEERKGREALEKVCEQLADEISSDKAEINRMRKEIEEERKMLRTAEVIREERVQMKLTEAKILLEEKFSEIEIARKMGGAEDTESSSKESKSSQISSIGEKIRVVLGNGNRENPHIRRGIKGFVEFPRVVRAIGCRSGKHLGSSKLECQKAQLNLLLKHKSNLRFIAN